MTATAATIAPPLGAASSERETGSTDTVIKTDMDLSSPPEGRYQAPKHRKL